ncbi:MAG TPA: type VI secretion system-associated FHA domain protein TagH [Burkholderiaceae bacterium]|nr:type VI secretion system-associated FHA domain protein TagH [Burkholderiaceae bacterium]
MIRITVQGASGQGAPSAEFGEAGGTIGRADTNTLVLSDPDRTVSRVHAQVLCRAGQFVVIDRGSNPMLHNGRALGAGQEAVLSDGDRLVIGSFQLMVSVQQAAAPSSAPAAAPDPFATQFGAGAAPAASDDPFADLLDGLGAPAPAPNAVARPAATPSLPEHGPFADPMGLGAAPPPDGAADPFADLLGPGAGGAPAPASTAPFDDFSDLGLPAAAAPIASGQRIDDLFGGVAGIGGDPLALSPLADPLLQPNTSAIDDPFAALGQASPPRQAPRPDHVPIGQFGYTPPKAVPAPAQPRSATEDAPMFDDQTGQPIRIGRAPAPALREPTHAALVMAPAPAVAPPPSSRGPTPPPSTPSVALPMDDAAFADLLGPGDAMGAAAPVPGPVPATAPPPRAAPAMPASPATGGIAAGDAELLAAFLRGLGSVHQAPSTLTPALMERIGMLLRASTEGTLQLLLTRQELKREVRAEVTMIAAQANNPLKFSPTVDVALAHLLGPGVRGFMPAEDAMRDAYDDLRSHQFGVMVGMRAALAKLIERFGPDELEKKIAAKSALDSLFASGRKARLWDQFVALYGTIAAEAEDDFHTLFGKAFLEAYEEQMARLKDAGTPARR